MVDYLSAGWWQLRAGLHRVTLESLLPGADSGPLIVLLPGVYEPWRFMLPLARALQSRGYRVVPVPGLGHNRRPVAEAAQVVESVLDELAECAAAEGGRARVVFLAHSKGGLIGKQLLVQQVRTPQRRPHLRLLGMVAIATPFAGSRYASRFLGRTLNEFGLKHQTILELQAHAEVNSRIVSVLPRFDPHIPGDRSLAGAREILLKASGHFKVLAEQETLEAIVEGIEGLTA
ncbi:esterase/lipase family protein [Psychromicrobium sp. YIM B11713]|uniref:esterase/lipase family protein n=1 Tax=Psychromicrobium sp. YIM B11713 TaxID=3145233 RepID=UPI00374E240A